jgi:hypothetical protein
MPGGWLRRLVAVEISTPFRRRWRRRHVTSDLFYKAAGKPAATGGQRGCYASIAGTRSGNGMVPAGNSDFHFPACRAGILGHPLRLYRGFLRSREREKVAQPDEGRSGKTIRGEVSDFCNQKLR